MRRTMLGALLSCALLSLSFGGETMQPRVTLITLGVDDLPKAVAFYRDGLGWATPGIVGKEFEHGAVAFFDLQPGLQLALWARDDIAHDIGIAKTPRR